MNNEQLQHKTNILKQVMEFHGTITDPLEIMQTFGGFEVAQMCGAMLQAHKNNMLIMVDGFIATAAFAVAKAIEPTIIDRAIFCHVSDESGHRAFLESLNQKAWLVWNLRVGYEAGGGSTA